jgi:preprotein translocase subunit SecA
MSALRSHLERIDRSQFLGVEIWKSLLNAIDSTSQMSTSDIKKMDDLRLLVRYILFLFDKTTNDSGGLLCHPDFCVLLIEAFFIKARDGDEIPPTTICEIVDLIINYKHFPLGALINATATIRYIVENQNKIKRELPADAMIRVVEDAIKTVNTPELDIDLKEASLRLLGVMLPDYPDNVICEPLLLGLIDSLGNKKLLSTSCTVLFVWVNTIKAPHFQKEFSRLFEKIVNLLATDLSIKKKMSLMSLLGRAAEKGFLFPDQLIDTLIINALSSTNLSLQQCCARTMAAVLLSQTTMRWSQDFFDLLIRLCQSVDKKDLMDDFSLLCHYMKLLAEPLTDPQMDQLAVLLGKEKTVEMACEVFLELVERGWQINEKCLDLLVNIILDDSSQAQLAATSLLEATAEKGQVFSKRVMERIIQGLSSDREEVVLSCVMMLNKRNIASLRSNDGALASKSLESLMKIAATGYNPSNIRFKACSVLIHFSEKSSLSFPVPLLEQLIGLLSDQNEKIRVLAMRLLSLQIPHLAVPISNGNTCISEIVDGVIPCLRDEKQQRDAILVLARMVALGYNNLSSDDLEEIATCLYIESDIETSQNVFAILEKYQSELKSTSKEIFEIQGVVLSFRDGTNEKKLESIGSLIRFVESRYRMTASVFQTLIEWTDRFSYSDDSEQGLLRSIFEFCEAVFYHEDMVPPFMLQSLSRLEGGGLSVDTQRHRSLLVARCLKKNIPVDPVAFPLVEEGFLADVDDREILLYLGALDAIVKQKPVIQSKTLEKLWALLSKNREIYRVAEILMNVFSADTFDQPQAPHHIDQLLWLVGKTSSKKIRKKLTGLIARLNHFITLELNQLQAIYESINATDSFEQEYQLCQLLKLQMSRAVNDFSDAYLKMIAFKEAEKEIIEKSKGLSGQIAHEDIINSFGTITAILTSSSHEPSPIAESESEVTHSRILEEGNHATTKFVLKTPRLSSDFFAVVEHLLKVFQNRELDHLLDLLKTIEEHQSLSDPIVESLLSLPDKHLKNSFDILECIMKKHHLNDQVLMMLKTIFLETSNQYCRGKSFEILNQTIEWISVYFALSPPQKTINRLQENLTNEDVSVESRELSLSPFHQALRTLVDVECTDAECLDIDRIFKHVGDGGELSLGNAELLLTRFPRSEHKQKILIIFDEVKSKLPRTICQQIFIAYKKEFFSFWYRKYHYFYVNFCRQILLDRKVDPTEEVVLFEELSTNILNSRRMTIGQFDMLFFLAKHRNLQLNQDLVIKMIDFYFFIEDSETRNKIIYFIFQNLIGLPIWSEMLLNTLTRLVTKLEGLQQIEVPTPASSSQLSTFLGILKNRFSSAVRAISWKPPDFPIDSKEEAPLLLDLLAFVIESEKSAGFFDRFEQRAKLVPIPSEDDLTERLKEMISKGDPPSEDQKLFLDLLLIVKKNHPKVNYRQVLRILLFKQNEEENNLAEMNELLAIFCSFSEEPFELLRGNLTEIRAFFFDRLLSPFASVKRVSFDSKQSLLKVYQKLDWFPIRAKALFGKLSTDATLDELSTLLTLIHDFSIGLDVVEDFNDGKGVSVSNLTSALKEYLLCQHLVKIALSDGSKAQEVNDRTSEWLRQSVLSAFSLCKQGWSFTALMDWLRKINEDVEEGKLNAIDIRNMSEILTLTCNYQEQIGEVSFYALVEKQFAQGKIIIPEILHAYVVNRHLTSYDKIKSLPKLIEEIRSSSINQKDSRLMEQSYIDEIRETLALVDQLYWSPAKKPRISGDVVSPLPVNEWSKEHIKKWAGQIKQMDQTSLISSSSSSHSHVSFEATILPECLAVFKRACILLFGYPPREVQLVALLLLAERTDPKILAQISTGEAKSLRGILAQISTGEGKSLIIAMFAALKALQGKKVDVITSSSELAKRDVKDYKPFYELFSLKVASNEDHQYESGMKKCYAKDVDVVYGDPSHFQWDVLRHEYGGLKTRGERGFDLVVMDEVDNVLIESNDSLTMLASPMPCMQELTPLLVCLWMRFLHLIELKDNRDLESEESDSSEGIELGEDSSDIESEKTESSDDIELEDTSSSPESEKKNPFNQVDITDDAVVKKVIETELLSYINMIVEDAEGGMQIPKHLKPFVKSQAKHWIQSAWLAKYQYEEGRDYRIEKNPEDVECIAPVDFANTGAIQLGTSWGEGLQQFLQLNHSLMIEPMTLVTNYSSIYSYIKRYHHRLGITGTLGSPGLQELLKETYRYDCVEIPTFLPRNRLTLSPQLLQNQELWMEAIVLNAIRDANLGRVVLIICETINTAEELHGRFQDRYAKPSLFLYYDDKNDSKYFLQKEQSPGTIVVATNLAGRGTDIRVSQDVIKKGGLHVCLTFLPPDKRVRNQAFGRTSRRGEPGTVQLILDLQAIKDQFPSCNIEGLEKDPKLAKNLPDAQECEKLEKIKTVHLPNIKQQQKLFRGYLSLLEEIKQIDQAQHSKFGVDRIKKQISVDRIYFEELCEIKRSALEERWGRWLRDILSQEDKTEATSKFLIFKEQMLEAYRQETIIDNPIYYIRLGNQLLNRASRYRHYFSKNTFYEKAIQAYDAAIAMDEIFSFIAYYHRAYAVIQLKKDGYKKNLKENFEKMQQALMNGPLRQHQATYLLLSQYNNSSLSFGKDFLNTQFQQQLQVYYLLLDSAKRAVQQIEESQKLIAIDSGVPSFSQTYSDKYTTKRVMKRLGIPPPSGIQAKFRLTFHHLKTHVDITKTSQLEHTIEKIPSQIPITLSFDGDKLYSEQGQKYHLRALLPACRKKIRQNERLMDASSDDRSSTSNPADASSKTASSHQAPVITLADRGAAIAAKSTELVSHVSSKVSKAMKSGKHVVVEKIDKFNDWRSSDNGTEVVPATLTIRDLTVKGMRELLEKFTSSSKPAKTTSTSSETISKVAPKVDRKSILRGTVFGIGPIKITTALLELLKIKCPQMHVSVWFPPQRDQEGILKHNEPISVSLSDPVLDRPEGEISILECSYDQLQNLLDFLDSQDPLLTSNLVLHRLKQATASQWIKIVTSSGTQSLEDRASESSMQLEWDNGNQKKKSPRSMVLSFVDLDHKQAINIARMTLAEHNNATLSINEIDADTAQTIIKAADRKEEDFSIFHHPIKAELEKICANPSFVVRQQLNGLHYLYDINERNPLPRKGLALLTTLSLLQIAGGVVITTFSGGAGAAAGSALISEGIGDATRIFSAVTNREFDGSTFMLQKSLSVAMNLSSCGLSGVKAVKKTVRKLDNIRGYLMEHGDEMIQVALTVGKKVLHTTKTVGLDHVKSGFKGIVQGSLKQGVQRTLTRTSGSFLKGVEPSLVQNMKRDIQDMFHKDHWQRILNKALAVDAFLNSCEEFTIISSKINTLILSAKFNMLDISEFNKKIILQFEKPFNEFLSQRFNHLKDLEDILNKKSIGLTSEEIKAGCAWLRNEKIIDTNGEIDLFIIVKYLTPSERPLSKDAVYDVKHYNLDRFTFDHSNLILPACLTYARFLRDYYLCKKREIIEKMTSDFSKELFHNLTTVVDLTNEVLHKTAGKMIDKGTEAVSKKFKQDVSRPSRRPPPGEAHSSSRRGFNANSPAPPPMAMETGMAPPPGVTGAPPPGFGDASRWVFKNDSGETVTLPPNAIFFSGTAHPPEGIGAPSPGSSDQLSLNSKMRKDGWTPPGIIPGSDPSSGPPPGASSSGRGFSTSSPTPPTMPIGTDRAHPPGGVGGPPPVFGDSQRVGRPSPGIIPDGKIGRRSRQSNGNRVQRDSSSSFTGSYNLVMESSGDFAIGFITEYFKNELRQSSKAKEAIKKDLLNEAIISSGQKMAELYRKLMSEQIKRLRCVIGLLLAASSSMSRFNEQEKEKLHQNVTRIYDLSLEAYERGQDPVIPELRQIGKDSKKAEVYVCIRTLEKGWAKYQELKQKESTVISNYLNQIHPNELLTNTWRLIERKNELGLLAGKGGLSEQMMMQGMVVQQVGNIVQAIIEADRMSDAARERVQCMALKMAKRSLLDQSELQKEILGMGDRSQTLIANIVSHQTVIGRMIEENYGKFLKEILEAVQIEDREARLMNIEKIKTSYHDNLALIDSRVQARVHIVKSNFSDPQFLTECTEQAALVLTQVLQIAEEMSAKDSREIGTLTSEIGRELQNHLTEGSQADGARSSSEGVTNSSDGLSISMARFVEGSSEDSSSSSSSGCGSEDRLTFSYNGTIYQREVDTCGDGACALHSLLGTRTRLASRDCIQYIWNPAELDVNREGDMIQRFAKQTFIDALKPIFHSESHPLKPILFTSVRLALRETLEFKEWDQQHDVEHRTIKERMRSQLTREFYLSNKEKFDPIFAHTEKEFTGLQNRLEEGAEDIADSLANCIDASFDELKQAGIEDSNWTRFLEEKENKKVAEVEREQRIIEFVQDHFEIYEKLVLDRNYYLDFEELALAAHIFKPKAKVMVFENKFNPPRIINPEATEEVISIEHTMAYIREGNHYNRIEVKME